MDNNDTDAELANPIGAPPAFDEFIDHCGSRLVHAAAPLFGVGSKLRETEQVDDAAAMRRYLRHELAEFRTRACAGGASAEEVSEANLAMGALLDEVVGTTPWGVRHSWINRAVLCGHSGPKFFALLERSIEDPQRNIDLMELLYACLAFGYHGSFPFEWRTDPRVSEIRQDLYDRVCAYRDAEALRSA